MTEAQKRANEMRRAEILLKEIKALIGRVECGDTGAVELLLAKQTELAQVLQFIGTEAEAAEAALLTSNAI